MPTPTPDSYNAVSGATIYGGMVAPSISFYGDIVVAGDSLTDLSYPSAPYRWGLPLAGSPQRVIYNAGIQNNTMDDLWARWQTDVLDKNPKTVLLRIGTNSLTTDVVGFKASYKRYTDSLLANNIFGVISAIPPKVGMASTIVPLNVAIKELCDSSGGRLKFADDGWVLTTDASYTQDASDFIDGIHHNTIGQFKSGVSLGTNLAAWFLPNDPRIASGLDTYYLNSSSDQWVRNPMMTGSAGGFYQASGVAPTDWFVGCNGGGTSAVCSVIAADVGDLNQTPWLRVSPTSGGSGHDITVAPTLTHPALTASLSPVMRLDCICQVRLNLDTQYVSRLSYGATDAGVAVGAGETMGLAGNGIISKTVILRTSYPRDERATLRAHNANSISFGITITTSGASSGSIGTIDYRLASVRGQGT